MINLQKFMCHYVLVAFFISDCYGREVVQSVSSRRVTAEVLMEFQAIPFGICARPVPVSHSLTLHRANILS